jgi:hypothetical protein
MSKDNKNDKILSTPSATGSQATSAPSNLTIASGHVNGDNDSLFPHYGDASDDNTHREKTVNLKSDTEDKK